jgi:hypothetical protein
MTVFVGFLLLTRYYKLPLERNYWSEDENLGLETTKKSMSKNNYRQLKTLMHLQDNDLSNENKHDRGFKIMHLTGMLLSNNLEFLRNFCL